jgi:hypothetical protein
MSLTYADHDPAQGDIAYRFEWSDCRDVGGIRLPYRLRRLIDGRPIREERLRPVTLNEPVSHEKFTIPAIVRAQDEAARRVVTGWTQRRRVAGLPYEEYTRIQHVDMAPLAPGVWLARGGTHNSLVIERPITSRVQELIQENGLSVEMIACAHGNAMPYAQFSHVLGK